MLFCREFSISASINGNMGVVEIMLEIHADANAAFDSSAINHLNQEYKYTSLTDYYNKSILMQYSVREALLNAISNQAWQWFQMQKDGNPA